MRIGLTYDLQTDPKDAYQAEFDPPERIEALSFALRSLGYEVVRLGNGEEIVRSPGCLRSVDLVFNIAEGANGRCREAWVPTLLEVYKVPYVGSPPLALSLALDKAVSKRLAISAGIPTPRWMVVEDAQAIPGADVPPFGSPAIVKPRDQGSGIGLDGRAIAYTQGALRERVCWLLERGQRPVIIEEFIKGGELTVCIIGNDPPVAYPAIQRPIDVKTGLAYHIVKPRPGNCICPVSLDEGLDNRAREMALRVFRAIGCNDVARVDCRVDEKGKLWFLEINPLPSFDPEGSFGLLAEYLGTGYEDIIARVLEAAVARLSLCAVAR